MKYYEHCIEFVHYYYAIPKCVCKAVHTLNTREEHYMYIYVMVQTTVHCFRIDQHTYQFRCR